MRLVRGGLRFLLAALFRVKVSGLSNLPAGSAGYVLVGAPHRNWVEPLLMHAYVAPRGRRVVTVADARAIAGSGLRRTAARAVGGVIPVGPGAAQPPIERVRAAASVMSAGDVLLIFPEIGGPTRPPELRPISAGVGHMAARAKSVVVPVAFGGTDELYLGRRIEIRVLPPVAPPPDARRTTIHEWTVSLRESVQSAATDAHERANAAVPVRKRWRWLTGNYPRME